MNEEEEDDDLFEDAAEEQPDEEMDDGDDNDEPEGDDNDDDDGDDDEGEGEGDDQEAEDVDMNGEGDDIDGDEEGDGEGAGDQGDQGDQGDKRDQEDKEEALLEQQLQDSMSEQDGGVKKDTFKHRYPIEPSKEALTASSYDIVPYVACLHSSPVYTVGFSWGLRWMFTGGADGFIRRYNFFESVNNKLPLTVAQRHPFVDSVTKSGVIASYWENEQPTLEADAKIKDGMYEPKVSPVYSLAVQSEALWLLAGLESGGITLQTVRHNEGQIQAYMHRHKSAVSVLKLDDDETRFLSGSWDKNIFEWDLNTGKVDREFIGSSGQIASIEWQPVGGSLISSKLRDERPKGVKDEPADEDDRKSMGSLFGDSDEEQEAKDNTMNEDEDTSGQGKSPEKEQAGFNRTSQSVFLSAAIDGTVDIWDRRMQTKAGHLYVPEGVPPWCTSACWSTDGNMIYIGRRNSTVDEFDIRSSLVTNSRRFKFPSVSGAVSTVATMPSGRHLLCGSHDNVRLYDLKATSSAKTPFYIVPGHHGGVLSNIYVDPSCQYLVTASGSRGWQGNSTDVALIYDINPIN